MWDFNNNLTEQFGDNFKQLNEACFQLVQWQKDHKDAVAQIQEEMKKVLESFKSIEQTHGKILDKNEKVELVYEKLEKIIQTFDVQVRSLNGLLTQYAGLGEKARNMFEITDRSFTSTSTNLENFSRTLQTSLNSQAQSITELTDKIKGQLPVSLNALEESLVTLTQRFAGTYSEFLNRIDEMMKNDSR